MPYTTINKGSSYFNTVLYTGNSASQSITVGFQPDFLWFKNRNSTEPHAVFDSVRPFQSALRPNSDIVEYSNSDTDDLSAITSTGFSLNGNGGTLNFSGNTYVCWNWLANNTSGSSNTSGTITSTVAANTTAGFSIVKYTGNGTSGATVGHGLGVAPKMIIVKNRTRVDAWPVDVRFASGILYLNETGTLGSYGSTEPFVSTAPTSTVFSLGSAGNTNFNTSSLIAYCFAEIKGYSKFATYTGNSSANGTFVYTGFKPAVVFLKATTNLNSWWVFDNKRNTFNPEIARLAPNLANAEANSESVMDFLSNGFKLRNTDDAWNASGNTYIYMAFAENPFVTSGGIPVTAR